MTNKMQLTEKQIFMLNGFSTINTSNIDDFYNRRYNRFKFDNSDEVTIDGVLVSKEEKTLIKFSNYIIKPTPTEIIVSDLINGFEITEKDFIEKELMVLEGIKYELLKLENRKQFTFYKDYLNNRNSGIISKVKSQKNKTEITFEDFFKDKVRHKSFIKSIKDEFGILDKSKGKEISLLIFHLHKTLMLIDFSEGRRRKHFVEALLDMKLTNISNVNKFLNQDNTRINSIDEDYTATEDKLRKLFQVVDNS